MVSKSQVIGAYQGKLSELARLGIDLTVIVPPRWGSQKLEQQQSGGFKLRVLPCWFSGHNHFHFYTENIGELDFDLIHLEEEPWSLVTYQFLRLAERQGKRVVFFTWQNIFKKFPPPFSWIERNTLAKAVGAIAGNAEAQSVISRKGFKKPIRLIPQLGIDPEVFRRRNVSQLRASLGASQHDFLIGYIGRVIQEKGIGDLIRSLRTLPSACKLVIVGDGQFSSKARQIAKDCLLSDRVLWVPQVSSLDVPDYMNLLDVLVLPSLTCRNWKEQFGRVLIEAMACETPVVGSSSGEIPNVIGDCGVIFPEGDEGALGNILSELFKSSSFREDLGERGRKRVLEKFTHRQIAVDTLEFYRELLQCGGARAMVSVPSAVEMRS